MPNTTPPTTEAPAPAPSPWLFGDSKGQRYATKRLMLTWPCYAFADLILCLAASFGYLDPWKAAVQVAYHMLGLTVFYLLLRSGKFEDQDEPTLAYPQVLFGCSAVVLSYALDHAASASALQMLPLILVFDLQRLSMRQLVTAMVGTPAALCVVLGLTWVMAPETIQGRRELLDLLAASILLPALGIIAKDVRDLRQRQLDQRVELQRTLKQLQDLSIHDSLTTLYNRQHMLGLLDSELKRQKRNGRPFSLAILDIDQFKQVNDRFGHAVGDKVLTQFAKLANQHIGAADTLARWGGEEFLLLMPEHVPEDGIKALEALRESVAAYDWGQIKEGLVVTYSAGITAQRAKDELKDALERADRGLRRANQQGKAQLVIVEGDQ